MTKNDGWSVDFNVQNKNDVPYELEYLVSQFLASQDISHNLTYQSSHSSDQWTIVQVQFPEFEESQTILINNKDNMQYPQKICLDTVNNKGDQKLYELININSGENEMLRLLNTNK